MAITSKGENAMRTVKSFVYLDEYKMYSISSQLFGGLTEYLIDYQEVRTWMKKVKRGHWAAEELWRAS